MGICNSLQLNPNELHRLERQQSPPEMTCLDCILYVYHNEHFTNYL